MAENPADTNVFSRPAHIAQVVVDIPSKQIDTSFDYEIPAGMGDVTIGSCVLVPFGPRPVIGYVVGLAEESAFERLKPLSAVLGGPYFTPRAPAIARWIADEYLCPLSEALRLFTPPGGTPRAQRRADGGWDLRRAGVGPVDDRWVLPAPGAAYTPRSNATMQRAVLDALTAGPVRAAELAADLGSVDGALRTLEKAGAITIERRRRHREAHVRERAAERHARLTDGQVSALEHIESAPPGGVIVVEGVTGSGKTEVYLRAIERVVEQGGTACVLVPEISLTPQTVGRFRSRFGDDVAVLHSRLSAGERFDQWDLVREGRARIVVGARSALFAPLENLKLIIIDEEHESSYKQGSAPRYHARDVAERLAKASGAVLVLGSASPSMESRHRAQTGTWDFVFASSCSVYGIAQGAPRRETDPVAPLTDYAKSKIGTEDALADIGGDMVITSLRFATACGMSDRLRLDLVLNDFVACALSQRKITVLSDGSPWRPLIDVADMARAIDWAIQRPADNGGRILRVNAGSNERNHQVRDLAAAVAEAVPGTLVSINTEAPVDSRSYQVDFGLFARLAPNHQPQMSLAQSIRGLLDGLQRMGFADPQFRTSPLMRLHVLQDHIAAGRLSEDLRWTR